MWEGTGMKSFHWKNFGLVALWDQPSEHSRGLAKNHFVWFLEYRQQWCWWNCKAFPQRKNGEFAVPEAFLLSYMVSSILFLHCYCMIIIIVVILRLSWCNFSEFRMILKSYVPIFLHVSDMVDDISVWFHHQREFPQNLKLSEEKFKFCDINVFFQIRKLNVESAKLYRAFIC